MRMPKPSVGLIVWRFDRKVSDAYSRWRDRNRGTVRVGGQRLEHPTHGQTQAPNAWLPVHLGFVVKNTALMGTKLTGRDQSSVPTPAMRAASARAASRVAIGC